MLFRIIKKIPRYIGDSFVIVYWKIRSLFLHNKQNFKKSWIICERGIEARDNGYAFFKYMRSNFPNKKVYYLIDPTNKIDYDNVKHLGNIIYYNSPEHRMAIFYAECLLSTHIGFITPWSYVCHKTFFSCLHCPKFVLLNHGITKEDMSKKLNKRVTGTDLFIAANEEDFNALTQDKRYGYKPTEVSLTGYARYDKWETGSERNQILFMPTWRAYLVNKTIQNRNTPTVIDNFKESLYYQMIQQLLNNPRLDELLNQHNMQMVFYPHYEMQSALSLWSTKCKNIVFADKQHYDIPTLMRESKILITDYSGVGFDFAYMYKPVLYYQFDQDEYYAGHYQRSKQYSLENNGLGPVVTMEEDLIKTLEILLTNQCMMPDTYHQKVDKFFTYHDTNNCQRIYSAVSAILN